MDEVIKRQTPASTTLSTAKPRKVYEADGRDRALLPAAWGIGVLLVNLFWAKGFPGFGISLLVFVWYMVLFWYMGPDGLKSRASKLLMGAIGLIALTFSLYSNLWLRGWNMVALVVLGAIQLAQWTEIESWAAPSAFPKGIWLLGRGAFGVLPASMDTVKSIKGDRRLLTVLLGFLLALPLLLLVIPLLVQADPYFAIVVERLLNGFAQLFGKAVFRLLLGLVLVPVHFGLLYSLRHIEKRESKIFSFPKVDPLLSTVILLIMDLLYAFFIVVQSTALFGGPAYLERVSGLSYAEYARSGFFQLVFVAGLNLTLILVALRFGKGEGKQLWLKWLGTVLILESGLILLSAAYRMTLYVSVYGLSLKRFLTYWGMAMLTLFFAVALRSVWKEGAAFFKTAFVIAVTGWLILNYCNVDRCVARYNVAMWQENQSEVIDLTYLTHGLSYDALKEIEELPGDIQVKWGRLDSLLEGRRREAKKIASDWRTWSFSAWQAAKG